jgi:patatin-like phospholipase/acyl hydrolase
MRILGLDGGGYLGLATAAFLAETERHFQTSCHEQFDFFCGTSTGAIITLALAMGRSAADVCDFYKDFGPKVFNNPIPGVRAYRFLKSFVSSRYSDTALKLALNRAFVEEVDGATRSVTLGDIQDKGKEILVPAFCLTTGYPRIFKTDYGQFSSHSEYLAADIALASASAPVYFPVARIEEPSTGAVEEFCDGGIFANDPAVMAFTDALHYMHQKPEDISILSVSTPRVSLREYASSKGVLRHFLLRRGMLLWSQTLLNVFIDSTSFVNDKTLEWLATGPNSLGFTYERFVMEKPPKAKLDKATRPITTDLMTLGRETAHSEDARRRLAPFFA